MNHFDSPILITGLPRSGTSLVAGCISLCGAFGGKVKGGTCWNEKGFFENVEIKKNAVKNILEENELCPVGVRSLPSPSYKFKNVPCIRIEVKKILFRHQYMEDMPWYFKDAKLALVWKVWQNAFPNAIWVVVTRNKESVINSCKNTSFMYSKGLSDREWEEWADKYTQIVNSNSLDTVLVGGSVLTVDTDRLMSGDYEEIKNVIALLELRYNSEIETFVDKSLWHH